MTSRTTQTTVRFCSSFELPGFNGIQPAGAYRVDRKEEQIEGISFLAWCNNGVLFHLPAINTHGTKRHVVPISSDELDAALEMDTKKHDKLKNA